jgi:hypothetical protein
MAVAVCGQNTSPCSRAWRASVADGGVVHAQRLGLGAQVGGVGEGPAQALEVAGGAHVHRVGEGGDRFARAIVVAREELGQGGIGVAGQAHLAHRQADLAHPQRGQRVAQVAGRHDEVERAAVFVPPAYGGVGVVAHLRQQAAEADAVGGAERTLGLQSGVVERGLDHALAVVEAALHAQRLHVVAEAAELVRLARRDQAVRVQDHHAHVRLAVERRADRRAGVAGGGDQDGERALVRARQPAQAGGEEARTHVLERGGGTVEQLQHVRVAVWQRAQRGVEIQRFPADRGQFGSERIAGEKRRQQGGRGVGQVAVRVEGVGRQPRQRFGHVQPAVRGEAGGDGAADRGGGAAAAGTEVEQGFDHGPYPATWERTRCAEGACEGLAPGGLRAGLMPVSRGRAGWRRGRRPGRRRRRCPARPR